MRIVVLLLVTVMICCEEVTGTEQHALGLSVANGILFKDGKPYRGIGANYFTLFYRRLNDPCDTSYLKGLQNLSEAGIPFVRFMCCGFWPIDWDLYLKNKDAYFALLDGVVAVAEQNQMGLIPSLFWYLATVPDITGEPMDQLGNPNSKTIAFIRKYTEEVVLRYRNSPAIWGWEFGNEYMLRADLPNAIKHRPWIRPHLKTATRRTKRDDLSSEHILVAFTEFARVIRKHDRQRILITGNAVPRLSAYHNSKDGTWEEDTPQQFAEILVRDNPDPFDTISVHIYPHSGHKLPGGAKDVAGLVRVVQQRSREGHKPVFVGEFGAPAQLGKVTAKETFRELVGAIESNGVSLAAFWVFDYSAQDGKWNITFDNERAYMIDIVAEANARMQKTVGGTKVPDEAMFQKTPAR